MRHLILKVSLVSYQEITWHLSCYRNDFIFKMMLHGFCPNEQWIRLLGFSLMFRPQLKYRCFCWLQYWNQLEVRNNAFRKECFSLDVYKLLGWSSLSHSWSLLVNFKSLRSSCKTGTEIQMFQLCVQMLTYYGNTRTKGLILEEVYTTEISFPRTFFLFLQISAWQYSHFCTALRILSVQRWEGLCEIYLE